jgi:hypothetical protein
MLTEASGNFNSFFGDPLFSLAYVPSVRYYEEVKVIVTTYRTANAKRVQIEVREESEAYRDGDSLQELYAGVHVDTMVTFRNSLLEKLSNKYDSVTARPLPEIEA